MIKTGKYNKIINAMYFINYKHCQQYTNIFQTNRIEHNR